MKGLAFHKALLYETIKEGMAWMGVAARGVTEKVRS